MNYNFLKSFGFVLALGAAGVLQATAEKALAVQKSPVLQVVGQTLHKTSLIGSAFLLRHEGKVFIVTATHVAVEARFSPNPFVNRLFVKTLASDKFYQAIPRENACCGDACVLQLQHERDIEQLMATTEVFELSQNTVPSGVTQQVFSCGVNYCGSQPQALRAPGQWINGEMAVDGAAQQNVFSLGHKLLKISECRIFPGMSGGPVLLNNQVLGINSQLSGRYKFAVSGELDQSGINGLLATTNEDLLTALKKYTAANPVEFLTTAKIQELKAAGKIPKDEPDGESEKVYRPVFSVGFDTLQHREAQMSRLAKQNRKAPFFSEFKVTNLDLKYLTHNMFWLGGDELYTKFLDFDVATTKFWNDNSRVKFARLRHSFASIFKFKAYKSGSSKAPVLQVIGKTQDEKHIVGNGFLLRHAGQVFVVTTALKSLTQTNSLERLSSVPLFVKDLSGAVLSQVAMRKECSSGDVCVLQLQIADDLEYLISKTEVFELADEQALDKTSGALPVKICGADWTKDKVKPVVISGSWLARPNCQGPTGSTAPKIKIPKAGKMNSFGRFPSIFGGPVLHKNRVVGICGKTAFVCVDKVRSAAKLEDCQLGLGFVEGGAGLTDILTAIKKYCQSPEVVVEECEVDHFNKIFFSKTLAIDFENIVQAALTGMFNDIKIAHREKKMLAQMFSSSTVWVMTWPLSLRIVDSFGPKLWFFLKTVQF